MWGGGGSSGMIKNMGKEVDLKAHREFHGILQKLQKKDSMVE